MKGNNVNIPDEIAREAQINGVLSGVTNIELFEELRRREVSPDTFKAYDYAQDQIESALTTNQDYCLRGGNVKEVL